MMLFTRSLAGKTAALLFGLLALSACSDDDDNDRSEPVQDSAEQMTVEEVFTASSPWATTGVFQQVDGVTDRSVNFIDDSTISAGTISSAQYRDGMFVFVGLSDFTTGSFNEASLIQSLGDVVANGANPVGFGFGDYAIVRDGAGNTIRRIRNASFAPAAVIDRTVTVANAQEFGYIFTGPDGLTYYVEHKPYAAAFPDATYPAELQSAIDAFFDARLTENSRIDLVLRSSSPWATTAVYRQVDGAIDTTTNFISDPAISAGTVSSAQYRDGHFVFVSMSDLKTGEFNLPPLLSSLTTFEDLQPDGFSFGDYAIVDNDQGQPIRRITNASFAPAAVIDRAITTATADLFTYTFTLDGTTYYVEHKPYEQAFPDASFPPELQTAIDLFFSSLD